MMTWKVCIALLVMAQALIHSDKEPSWHGNVKCGLVMKGFKAKDFINNKKATSAFKKTIDEALSLVTSREQVLNLKAEDIMVAMAGSETKEPAVDITWGLNVPEGNGKYKEAVEKAREQLRKELNADSVPGIISRLKQNYAEREVDIPESMSLDLPASLDSLDKMMFYLQKGKKEARRTPIISPNPPKPAKLANKAAELPKIPKVTVNATVVLRHVDASIFNDDQVAQRDFRNAVLESLGHIYDPHSFKSIKAETFTFHEEQQVNATQVQQFSRKRSSGTPQSSIHFEIEAVPAEFKKQMLKAIESSRLQEKIELVAHKKGIMKWAEVEAEASLNAMQK